MRSGVGGEGPIANRTRTVVVVSALYFLGFFLFAWLVGVLNSSASMRLPLLAARAPSCATTPEKAAGAAPVAVPIGAQHPATAAARTVPCSKPLVKSTAGKKTVAKSSAGTPKRPEVEPRNGHPRTVMPPRVPGTVAVPRVRSGAAAAAPAHLSPAAASAAAAVAAASVRRAEHARAHATPTRPPHPSAGLLVQPEGSGLGASGGLEPQSGAHAPLLVNPGAGAPPSGNSLTPR